MSRVTLGGERLGSGGKNTVDLKTYNRSTHDLGFNFKTTMSAGTLVPFMCELGLPGDKMDIDLNCDILTHPTIGPLFGSYKVQLDVFKIPVRLYNSELHMDKLNIGNHMDKVKLPQIQFKGKTPRPDDALHIDNAHINPSCIFNYLGIRGLRFQ